MTSLTHTHIKVCGLTREQDVLVAVDAGVNAVGFVLYNKSARYVSIDVAKALCRLLPPFVVPVLLFVNPTQQEVMAACEAIPNALLQFHGDETPEFCQEMSRLCMRPYIRCARIPTSEMVTCGATPSFDFLQFTHAYAGAKGWLFDTLHANFGGMGQSFSWEILPKSLSNHVIVAGGLTIDNVEKAMDVVRGRGFSLSVDVSSGIEMDDGVGGTQKGIKDAEKIRAFVAAVKRADDFSWKNSNEK